MPNCQIPIHFTVTHIHIVCYKCIPNPVKVPGLLMALLYFCVHKVVEVIKLRNISPHVFCSDGHSHYETEGCVEYEPSSMHVLIQISLKNITIFFISWFSNTGTDPPPCGNLLGEQGWVCWDQSCYRRLPDTYSYADAHDQCASQCQGSDLVVINSPEEDVFLQRTFTGEFWIGCSDEDHEGHWHCVDHMGLHYDETIGQADGYWRK